MWPVLVVGALAGWWLYKRHAPSGATWALVKGAEPKAGIWDRSYPGMLRRQLDQGAPIVLLFVRKGGAAERAPAYAHVSAVSSDSASADVAVTYPIGTPDPWLPWMPPEGTRIHIETADVYGI